MTSCELLSNSLTLWIHHSLKVKSTDNQRIFLFYTIEKIKIILAVATLEAVFLHS